MATNLIHFSLIVFCFFFIFQVTCDLRTSQKFLNGYSNAGRFNMEEADNFCHSFSAHLPELHSEEDIINLRISFSMHVTKILLGHTYDKNKGWIDPSRDNKSNSYLNELLSKENASPNTCLILNLKPHANDGKWKIELQYCYKSVVSIVVCSVYEPTEMDYMMKQIDQLPDLIAFAMVISIISFISAFIGVVAAILLRLALIHLYVKLYLSGTYILPSKVEESSSFYD